MLKNDFQCKFRIHCTKPLFFDVFFYHYLYMSRGFAETRHFQKCRGNSAFPQLPRHFQKMLFFDNVQFLGNGTVLVKNYIKTYVLGYPNQT